MSHNKPGAGNTGEVESTDFAVNPNPAANGNIQPQLQHMDEAEKAEATSSPNSEITDGEGG